MGDYTREKEGVIKVGRLLEQGSAGPHLLFLRTGPVPPGRPNSRSFMPRSVYEVQKN